MANSKEIDQTAKHIAKGSEEQTIIVQKTAVSLDNGLNQMDEMVRQSAETFAKVNEAKLRTEKGEAEARKILGYLDDVLKQMVEHTQPIFELASKVEKMKMVVDVIDDIAQRTDLLSLNASIEATRAGEAGKGFALVADEIRNMADNSKRSSQDIREMIESILEDNQSVSIALNKSQEGIHQGRDTIHRLVNTFGETLKGVKDIAMTIQDVEEGTGKQVKQMRGLLTYFQELSRLANKNFVSTQKTTIATRNQKEDMIKIVKAMKSLNSLSAKMMETQRRFKLTAGHEPVA
jgi:methyl-accepting chemotaxis protein